jgi:hypothetical protein
MSIIETIKNFFTSSPDTPEEVIIDYAKQESITQDNNFQCHYCHISFVVNPSKDIFPTSVRLLYKDQYITGKGVLCPHCKKTCIFG